MYPSGLSGHKCGRPKPPKTGTFWHPDPKPGKNSPTVLWSQSANGIFDPKGPGLLETAPLEAPRVFVSKAWKGWKSHLGRMTLRELPQAAPAQPPLRAR